MSETNHHMTDSALSDHCKEFISRFKDESNSYKYVERIDEMFGNQQTSIILDITDFSSDEVIEELLRKNADRIIPALIRAVKETLQVRHPEYATSISDKIKVRLSKFALQSSFDQVDADVIGKLISISGIVLRASVIKPKPETLVFVCPDEHPTKVDNKGIDDMKIPIVCENPKCKHRDFELKPEASKFVKYQVIRIQEFNEGLAAGHRPLGIDVDLLGNMTDIAKPGDRINLTGIVRLGYDKQSQKGKAVLGYHIRIEGNNVEFVEGKNSVTLSKTDEKELESLSNQPDIIQRLIHSFAPQVKGNEDIKEGILYAMVGAPAVIIEDIRKRGDIHVFLVGDPGSAKSEMLKTACKIHPRGHYTSGRGNSGVGLTATVVQDNNGMWTLEAGPLVLGDQGLVAVDEFDKMKSEDRAHLHEGMEQQTISIAKGGIVATLNARTTIIAAANPIKGKYDVHEDLYQNLKEIPIPLLTRFDLIFIVKDIPNKEKDKEIAKHIFSLYSKKTLSNVTMNSNELTKYISYARKLEVAFPEELESIIVDYYVKIRSMADDAAITITPRQLEGIVRISTARARLRLNKEVEEEDVRRAIEVFEDRLKEIGIDPSTGKVDYGILEGMPASQRKHNGLWLEVLKIFDDFGEFPKKELVEEMIKTGEWNENSANEWLREKFNHGSIVSTKPGFVRVKM